MSAGYGEDRTPEQRADDQAEAWAQLFASVRAEFYGDWLDCCQMHGPLHADDCPTREQWGFKSDGFVDGPD